MGLSIRTAIIALILILVFPNVYAQQTTDTCGTWKFDCYQDVGFRLASNPIICFIPPSDRNVVATMRAYVEDAVSDWNNQLKDTNMAGQKWNIQLVTNTNSDSCNISIQFIAKPTSDQQSVADYVGVTNMYSDHTAKILIFYNELTTDEYGSFYFLDSLAPAYQIQWTIKHELGHAFGLDHYIMTDDELKNWAAGYTLTPSIMVVYVQPKYEIAGTVVTPIPAITHNDIVQLRSLYPNGFGGSSFQQSIPTINIPIPNTPSPIMSDSDISYWKPLIREYFVNNTNNLDSKDYPVNVLYLVDIFDAKGLTAMTDPVGDSNATFFMRMPPWFANDLSLWANSKISDSDLASAMQYLYNKDLFIFHT